MHTDDEANFSPSFALKAFGQKGGVKGKGAGN
jgi:hypothetical protein